MKDEDCFVAIGRKELAVRLVRSEERARWGELMRQHHYMGFDRIIGECLCYVASVRGEWAALLGWGSAALKCGVRDQWIGWDRALQWQRLQLVANNVRFLMLPGWNQPNLRPPDLGEKKLIPIHGMAQKLGFALTLVVWDWADSVRWSPVASLGIVLIR